MSDSQYLIFKPKVPEGRISQRALSSYYVHKLDVLHLTKPYSDPPAQETGGGGLKTMCLTQENRIMKVSCRLTSGRGQTQIVQDMKTEAKKQIGSRRGVYKCCSVRACGLRMKNPICMIRARYSACRRYLTDVLSIGGFNTQCE